MLVRSVEADAVAELADLSLTLAAFGQQVTWVWCGDAAFLLAETPAGRLQELLPMLSEFGVQHRVTSHSLAQLHLEAQALAAEVVDDIGVQQLLANADHCLGWS